MNVWHTYCAITHEAARYVPVKDFEDLLQYRCAKTNGCDTIITFNKKDFDFSDIPVFTPKEFLQATAL